MKKKTGSKKVIRAIALALATTVLATSVPITTNADEHEELRSKDSIIVVDSRSLDFSSDNISTETQQIVTDTGNASNAAADAATAATAAQTAATAAQTAATAAATAAQNAEAVARLAQDAAAALTDKVDVENVAGEVDTAATSIATSNTDTAAAISAEGEADAAISTANGEIADYNAQVDNANTAITAANNSKTAENTGTDALIQAANDQKTNVVDTKIQDAKDKAVSDETINQVKETVRLANEAYENADSDGQKAINAVCADLAKALTDADAVSGAKDAAGAAETAKTNAETFDGNAQKALDNTQTAYDNVKKLVDTGSHDVASAQAFAKEAADAAADAAKAAEQAGVQASAAATAEQTAKDKYEAILNILIEKKAALETAKTNYEAAYTQAETGRTSANTAATTLNGNIDDANTAVATAKQAVTDYNNNEVKNANDAIAETNRLIGVAEGEIEKLGIGKNTGLEADYIAAKSTADGKKTTAGEKGDTAVTSLSQAKNDLKTATDDLTKAIADLEEAKKAYDTASANNKKASDYAQTAADKAQEAANKATEASGQEAIAQSNEAVSKDYLAQTLQGTSYSILQNNVSVAQSNLDTANEEVVTAQGEKDAADAVLLEKQNAQIAVNAAQDPIIAAQQSIIDAKTTELGSAKTSGLYKQRSDLNAIIKQKADDINKYNSTITSKTNEIAKLEKETIPDKKKAYDKAEAEQKEKQKELDALPEWRIVSRAVVWAELQSLKGKTDDAKDDWGKAITAKTNAETDLATARTNLANAITAKSKAETELNGENGDNGVNALITAAETAKNDATKLRDEAQGKKDAAKRDVEAAQGDVNSAQSNLQNKQSAVTTRTQELQTAQANLKSVDDFVATNQNAVALTAQEAEMINKIVQAYGSGYDQFNADVYSFLATNADTKAYEDVMSSTELSDLAAKVGNFFTHLFTGENKFDDERHAREKQIEDKYNTKGNVFVIWDSESGKLLDWSTVDKEKNLPALKGLLNKECVLICDNVKMVSEIKASLAVLNAAQAVADANQAVTDANTAKQKAAGAAEAEKAALENYDTAMSKLTAAKTKLEGLTLNNQNYAKKTFGAYTTVKTVNSSQLTGKYTSIQEATYTGPSEISDDKKVSKIDQINEIGFDKVIGYIDSILTGVQSKEGLVLDEDDNRFIESLYEELGEADASKIVEMISEIKEAGIQAQAAKAAYEDAKQKSTDAKKAASEAEKKAGEAKTIAQKAVELSGRVLPARENDDDDDSSSDEPATPEVGGYVATSADTIVLTPVSLVADAAGVAGVRSGRTSRGVAGVRVENVNDEGAVEATKPAVDKNDKAVAPEDDNAKKDAKKTVKKIDNNEVPLAESPFEDGAEMSWWWLLLFAAAAGTGIYIYENRKRKAANADEMRRYKK